MRQRTEGHFRLYTADDIARLTFIKQMQGLGFSFSENQATSLRDRGGHACGEVKNLLNSKLVEILRGYASLELLVLNSGPPQKRNFPSASFIEILIGSGDALLPRNLNVMPPLACCPLRQPRSSDAIAANR